MDIHKPKAIHSWREFLKELGTIVLGILIALGLEQAVEARREHQLAAEAHEAILAEMQVDLDRVDYRMRQQACRPPPHRGPERVGRGLARGPRGAGRAQCRLPR